MASAEGVDEKEDKVCLQYRLRVNIPCIFEGPPFCLGAGVAGRSVLQFVPYVQYAISRVHRLLCKKLAQIELQIGLNSTDDRAHSRLRRHKAHWQTSRGYGRQCCDDVAATT